MAEIKKKLREVQLALKVPKTQYNSFGKYKYRSTEDILEAVKPLLAKSGCSLSLTDEVVNIGDRFYVKSSAVFSDDTESIEVIGYAREEESKKGMDGSQITGASSSYARKYALNGLFLIDDAKDSNFTNKGGVDYTEQLKHELKKYTDPKKLEENKVILRDKYMKLGLGKKEATEIILGYLNDF